MSLSHAELSPQGKAAPRVADTLLETTPLPVFDLGVAPYAAVQGLQRRLRQHVAAGRIPGVLLLLEHPPVITLGSRGSQDDLRGSTRCRSGLQIPVVVSERGGAATLHAPGQLVSYPVWPIPGRDLGRYVFNLEDVLVRVLADYHVDARRARGRPGLYVGDLKIASVGLRCRRWVASHGTSLNVTIDLSLFDLIVSCGEAGLRQTSVAALTGFAPSMASVKTAYARCFREVMGQPLHPPRVLGHAMVERELGLESEAAR